MRPDADETSPEQILAELRELGKKIPSYDDSAPGPSTLDAELILGRLAAMRKKIPFLAETPPRQPEDARFQSLDGMPIESEEDFEWAAVIDAFESLRDDLRAGIQRQRAAMVEKALALYYEMEEASRLPENAHLIEQLEKMRAAYEKDFGRPIPPKGKK